MNETDKKNKVSQISFLSNSLRTYCTVNKWHLKITLLIEKNYIIITC